MAKQDPMLELSVEKLRIASMDPDIRMQYEAREKALKDIESIRADALEEGIETGIEKGKQEEKEEMAIKMFKKEMNIDLIIEFTGLSHEKLMKLKNKLNN